MDNELKSCPFCGGKAYMSEHEGWWNIGCLDCDAEISRRGKNDIIAAWNNREPLDTLLDTITQAVGGFDFDAGIGERAPMAVLNNALMAHGRESARIRRDYRDYAAELEHEASKVE